jgi:hypothetical protein
VAISLDERAIEVEPRTLGLRDRRVAPDGRGREITRRNVRKKECRRRDDENKDCGGRQAADDEARGQAGHLCLFGRFAPLG